jgi:hypothetical protein
MVQLRAVPSEVMVEEVRVEAVSDCSLAIEIVAAAVVLDLGSEVQERRLQKALRLFEHERALQAHVATPGRWALNGRFEPTLLAVGR